MIPPSVRTFPGVRVLSLVALAVVSAAAAAYLSLVLPSHGKEDDSCLARVGDRTITVRAFLTNYEFGYPHLKTGSDPVTRKRSYLRAMVNELLIAHEGFRLGLDKSPRVRDEDGRTMTELLTGALIKNEVVAAIRVSDEEVRDAINRSNASFTLRYWGEPTLPRAQAVRRSMTRIGFAPAIDSLRKVHADVRIDPAMLESGEMNAFAIDPEVLAAIKDLGTGDISDPVALNGGFYLFQVTGIKRHGVMEHEYASRFETMKKVLLNQRYDERIAAFVGGFMTAKHVVTKAGPFGALCDAVLAWKVSGDHRRMMFRDAVLHPAATESSYRLLASMSDEPIVHYEGGRFTVREFLNIFRPALKDLDGANPARNRHLLSEQVALTVRDQLLAAEARRRGLDTDPGVVHEREQWLRKAVYDETCLRFLEHMAGNGGLRQARMVLEHKADSLRAIIPVAINDHLLDTLTIHESASSRMLGMQVFKLGSKRPAIPVTDGIWGILDQAL
jgi:hypothetical protein